MERYLVIALVLQLCVLQASCNLANEQKLHHYLMEMKGYNRLVLPPGDIENNTPLVVKLGLRLVQLLLLEEKSQILTSNVWLRHEWYDRRLKWDPDDFGGITFTQFPSKMLWLPDIILYNNADGDFVITLFTKATVYYNGSILWEPPAIYKSYCPINVEFFPFDQQECFMKFGSWSYDGTEVDLRHVSEEQGVRENNVTIMKYGIDLCDYYQNVEWDVINVTARRKEKFYPCCPGSPYPDITFNITIRRKTLFYTINLILPIVAISGLTVLVFYLPVYSRQKITLCINILLTVTVFFLLIFDINPPTSIVVPLLGKYLLFTMIVVTLSIFLTVYILSIHYRSPATHDMSSWTKILFTQILPKILCMKRPMFGQQPKIAANSVPEIEMAEMTSVSRGILPPNYENLQNRHSGASSGNYSQEIRESLQGVTFIAEHMKKGAADDRIIRDWNFVAMVMDRMFLFIFTTACVCGTLGIFLNAPTHYDPRGPMGREEFNCSKSRVG